MGEGKFGRTDPHAAAILKPHVAVDRPKGPFLMRWRALHALSLGELTPDQQQCLRGTFQLDATPRTEGPGAAGSMAHRSFADDNGTRLVLDVARTGEFGWVFTLFYQGERPSADTVEDHRALFRAAIDRLGLTIVEITPAATADEVLVPSGEPSDDAESAFGSHWYLPYDDLDRVWPHVGLRADAPREVKEVELRQLMRTPAWSSAPTALRLQAERFLRGE